jgi:peptidoglycan/xylan/chitin deacetylase (PgdA/CDA1 family)
MIQGLRFILSSRGISRIAARLVTVSQRFGFSSRKQIGYIRHYISLVEQHGGRLTLFIPACILERHQQQIGTIGRNACLEWGIHGFVHTDMSRLASPEIICHIYKMVSVFDKRGVVFKGFRAPYLRASPLLLEELSKSGRFLYDSSASVYRDDVTRLPETEEHWMQGFYKPGWYSQKPACGTDRKKVPVIPVTLPDDDILVDRLGKNAREVLDVWMRILERCHANDEVFVLQLHPERIYELEPALVGLMVRANSLEPRVRMTTLSGVTDKKETGTRGTLCITGDIDSLNWADFVLRVMEW